jgi:DNA-binding NtrC family response regulator
MLAPSKPHIFLVDDDPALRDSLKLVLKNDFKVSCFASGNEALESLHNSDKSIVKERIELALLDVMMPGIDGIELLKQIKSYLPNLPVVMVSASNTVKTAVDAMRLGAVDYISKPFQIEELIERIYVGLSTRTLNEDIEVPSVPVKDTHIATGDFGCMVGTHPLMQELYQKIEQVAPRDTTVLITGESGTGKELIAKELHKRSSRASAPFIAINCAAIPETLVESELFGHEKGSFTHAMEKRMGHFEIANGGTIFLDEIGELPLSVQVKLLRVLQEREFFRIGNSKTVSVDVRVLAATNKSLERAVEEGSFRQDLFFRVHVVNLELPPLRKRKEDIPKLVTHFIHKLSSHYGDKLPEVTEDFISSMINYKWPGNVRELENVIESIMALSTSQKLQVNDIPHRIRQSSSDLKSIKDLVVDGIVPFEEAEKKFETEIITKALEKSNYVQTKAADLLGISRRILKYKMDKLGIVASDNE